VCRNFLVVLEFQKLVAPVSSHVDEHIAPGIAQEAFRARNGRIMATCEDTEKILNSHFVTSVVDFDVITIQVQIPLCTVKHSTWIFVPSITGSVIGQHQDNVGVGNTQPLHGTIHAQGIGHVSIIEPVSRSTDKDGPVRSVIRALKEIRDLLCRRRRICAKK
jgi:hypothetical protein